MRIAAPSDRRSRTTISARGRSNATRNRGQIAASPTSPNTPPTPWPGCLPHRGQIARLDRSLAGRAAVCGDRAGAAARTPGALCHRECGRIGGISDTTANPACRAWVATSRSRPDHRKVDDPVRRVRLPRRRGRLRRHRDHALHVPSSQRIGGSHVSEIDVGRHRPPAQRNEITGEHSLQISDPGQKAPLGAGMRLPHGYAPLWPSLRPTRSPWVSRSSTAWLEIPSSSATSALDNEACSSSRRAMKSSFNVCSAAVRTSVADGALPHNDSSRSRSGAVLVTASTNPALTDAGAASSTAWTAEPTSTADSDVRC